MLHRYTIRKSVRWIRKACRSRNMIDRLEFSSTVDQPSATEIRLVNMSIGDERVLHIASRLRHDTCVRVLNLHDNNIGDDGAFAIAMCLLDNSTLQLVCLSRNYIGVTGVMALSDVLPLINIKTLCLQQNALGNAACRALATNLSKSKLHQLYLHSNLIGNEGCQELAKAFSENSKLQALDLSDNCIGNAGIVALSKALSYNTTLKHLFVGDNKFGLQGYQALLELVKYHNTSLQLVDARKHSRQMSIKESEVQKQISHLTSLADERCYMRSNDAAGSLLPFVLGRVSRKPEMCMTLLLEAPHVWTSHL